MPLPLDGHDTGGHRLPAHLGVVAGSLASSAASSSSSNLNSIPTNPIPNPRDDYYPRNAPTSSATLNSILTTTTTSTIPQKRKQPGTGLGIYGYDGPLLNASSSGGIINHHHHSHLHHEHMASPRLPTTPIVPPPPPFRSAATPTPSHPPPTNNVSPDSSNDGIECMCGFTIDDGYSIQCDQCERWCHAVCFGISKEENNVPDVWLCWVCQPRPSAMREAAVRTQSERLLLFGGAGAAVGFGPGGGLLFDEDGREGKRGRKLSPGHDRKGRRGSNAAIDGGGGGKRRRRASVIQPGASPNITSTLSTSLNGAAGSGAGSAEAGGSAGEDQHVDIDEPWKDTYVHISEDIIPNDETRYRLRKQAMNWRGITAVSTPPSSAPPPPVTVKELPPQTTYNPLLTLNSNPSVLPPTYGLHTTAPIPSEKLITPYTSSITPSTSYLSDPLNAYAHLGMPKPFVHLLGPPLDVALDSRLVGNYGRFVRSGCRPNAVLRPVLCNKARGGEENKENRDHAQQEEDGRTLGFGVFALRDLKAGEEVVLGWEWDDGNAVHCLPALLSTPHMFPADRFHLSTLNSSSTFPSPNVPPPPSSTSPFTSIPTPDFTPNASTSHKRSPHEIAHLRAQISNILHALSSTFTTCACGGRARDCVLTQMATFVDGPQEPEQLYHQNYREKEVDLGPLVGRKRGFKTRERIPNSGGIGGMEMWVDEEKGEGGSRRVNGAHSVSGAPNANGTQAKHVNGVGARTMGPPPVPPNRRSRSPSVVQQQQLGTPVEVPKSRKGKEKAVVEDEDVEMEDGSRVRSDSISSSTTIKPRSRPTALPAPSEIPSTRRTRSQTSRPPPPDPPPVPPDPEEQRKAETKMPPKMRKRWMHHEAERLMKDREEREVDVHLEVNAVGVGEERRGLGIRIEVDAPGNSESDSTMLPPSGPSATTVAAHASPERPQSPSPSSPPSQSETRPSISSLTTLLTPTPTPTLPTPSSASPPQSLPPPTSTSAAAVANNAFPSPSLASFANLSLLSPALANGPQTPSLPQPSQLRKVLAEEKVPGYPFPPGSADSPSPPSRFAQGWTPLKRVDSSDKAGVEDAQAEAEKPRQPLAAVTVTQKGDGESSIASSSANTPGPELPTQHVDERKESEDVEMEDGEEPEKVKEVGEPSVEAGELQSKPDLDHDRAGSPVEEMSPPPPPIQEVRPEEDEDTTMKVDEPSKRSPTPSFPVRTSPTPPPSSEPTPVGDTSEPPEAPKESEEPSPTITITEPAPRPASPPRSATESVQPSPSTVLSSLPSPSPSPAPGANASSSSQGQASSAAPAPQPKVKMSLKDFAMRKRKQKEKEAELVKTKGKDGGEEKSEEGKGKEREKEGEIKSETASMVVDKSEKTATADKEKDVEMSGPSPTMSVPAASAPAASSASSPTTTATPTTPAFDPKAFSEAAAAILNGQHRPQLQHLPIMNMEFENGFPRIRGASPLLASLKAQATSRTQSQSHSRPRTPAQASGSATSSSSQPTLKVKEGKDGKAQSRPRSDVPTLSQPSAKAKEAKRQQQGRAPPTVERPSSRQKTLPRLDTKEMKKEAVETSLALSTPPSSAVAALPKDGLKVDKDSSTLTSAPGPTSNSAGSKDLHTGQGKDKPQGLSGTWVASSADLGPRQSAVLAASANTPPPRLDGTSGVLGKDVARPLASRLGPDPSAPKLPSPPPPAKPDPQPEREPPHAHQLRSVSPMGPDMMRPEVQITPPSLGGSGFSAHSRMSSREDGEIVGDGSPLMLPRAAASPTPMSTVAGGRGPPLYYPPVPASPPAPASAKPGFGPSGMKTSYAPPSVSPSPSFSRNPPTGPSYYQRMSASRAGGQPDGSTNAKAASPPATPFNVQSEPRGAWNTSMKVTNTKLANQPEPPKAPRALRQSMLANRGGAGGGGAGSGAAGAASPVQSTPVSDPSSLARTPSQTHIHPPTPITSNNASFSNGNAAQGPFAPRGPSADGERERDLPDRGRSRFGDRDRDVRDAKDASREGGRDASVGSSGAGGGGEARPSLRDRIDWDRYPRGSGSGMRRWGR